MNVVIKSPDISFTFNSSMRIKVIGSDVHIEDLGGFTLILPLHDTCRADAFYRMLMKAYGEYAEELVVNMDEFLLPFS